MPRFSWWGKESPQQGDPTRLQSPFPRRAHLEDGAKSPISEVEGAFTTVQVRFKERLFFSPACPGSHLTAKTKPLLPASFERITFSTGTVEWKLRHVPIELINGRRTLIIISQVSRVPCRRRWVLCRNRLNRSRACRNSRCKQTSP